MKYVFINVKNSKPKDNIIIQEEERILLNTEESEGKVYVCEKCFKEFKQNGQTHLSNCEIYKPTEGIMTESKFPTFMLFRIDNEESRPQRAIIKAIERLGWFSKVEQGLDFPIPKTGLLKTRYFPIPNEDKFYCYVLFFYNSIIGYCWVQTYSDILCRINKVVLRDIYLLPQYRGNFYSIKMIRMIANDFNIDIENLIFNRPISEKFKKTLKKSGLNKVKVITAEDFKSWGTEYL